MIADHRGDMHRHGCWWRRPFCRVSVSREESGALDDPRQLRGFDVVKTLTRCSVRGFPAKQGLVSQRCWTVNEGAFWQRILLFVLFTLHNLCVCSHCFSESASSFKFFIFYLFLFLFLFVYLYRVGSLNVGGRSQQPGAAVTPWTRVTWVMPLLGPTSGGPIHTTRIVPGTPHVRRRSVLTCRLRY